MSSWLVSNKIATALGSQALSYLLSEFMSYLLGDLLNYVEFEVFTAVVMKSIIFWDMKPRSPLSFILRFGGTYRLHLQGRRNKFSKNQQASR
jgi:hypothetical protein